MNQKALIKYGLLIAGAYLIYRYIQDHGGIDGLLGATTATPLPSASGAPISLMPAPGTISNVPGPLPSNYQPAPAPAPGPAYQPAPVPAPTAVGPTTLQKVAQAAGASALNFDQWCWYYAQVTGVPCPDPNAIYSGDRTQPIDINTWWTAMTAAGMSGLGLFTPRYTPAWLN